MGQYVGLVVISALATLAVLWLLPPTGSFAVNAKVVS